MPGESLDLLQLYNTFFSPEAKERKLELQRQQQADKYFNSPEYAASHGGVPVGALSQEQLYQQIQGMKAATAYHVSATQGQNLQNKQTEGDLKMTGGVTPQLFEYSQTGKPEAQARTSLYQTQSDAAKNALRESQQTSTDVSTATGGKYKTPAGAQIASEIDKNKASTKLSNAQAAQMTTEAAAFIPTDPTARASFFQTMKSLGYDTSGFDAMDAERKARADALLGKLGGLTGGTKAPTPSPFRQAFDKAGQVPTTPIPSPTLGGSRNAPSGLDLNQIIMSQPGVKSYDFGGGRDIPDMQPRLPSPEEIADRQRKFQMLMRSYNQSY